MKKLATVLILMLITPSIINAQPQKEEYLLTFSGYLGIGDVLTFGNYTLTVEDILTSPRTGLANTVLFKLRDNVAFNESEFSLQEGQEYQYKDVKIKLVVITFEDNPRALIRIYSKAVDVFYGDAYERSIFRYGPIKFIILEIKNETFLARYEKNGEVDYRYFGTGYYYWNELSIYVENITNKTVRLKIKAPKYAQYAIIRGAEITIEKVDFGEVEIGSPFKLSITLRNVGNKNARFISVYLYSKEQIQEEQVQTLLPTITIPQFESSLPFAAYRESPIKYLEVLAPGEEKTIVFTLISSKNLKEEVYPLYIKIEYQDEDGAKKSKEVQVGIPVEDKIRPKVIIEEFKIIPPIVQPDSNFTVRIKLRNIGNSIAKHVKVKVTSEKPEEEKQTTYPYFPSGEGTVQQEVDIFPIRKQSLLYFSEVNTTAEGELYFKIKQVQRGIYPLYVTITYEDENGVVYREETMFGVEVSAYPLLDLYIGNIWESGGKYNFEVYVVNEGKDVARGVTLDVTSKQLELFPIGQRYVGSIAGLDYDSVNFQILNKTIPKGEYVIHAKVYYKDEKGQEKTFEKDLVIRIPETLSYSERKPYEYYIGGGILLLFIIILLWRRKSVE
ncbi:COG1361 S-layer family protein [Thermococcus sp.]